MSHCNRRPVQTIAYYLYSQQIAEECNHIWTSMYLPSIILSKGLSWILVTFRNACPYTPTFFYIKVIQKRPLSTTTFRPSFRKAIDFSNVKPAYYGDNLLYFLLHLSRLFRSRRVCTSRTMSNHVQGFRPTFSAICADAAPYSGPRLQIKGRNKSAHPLNCMEFCTLTP
jgi:hypothetical protein